MTEKAHVCLIHLEFFFPEVHSLKEKRHFLRKLKDRLGAKFNASVAEVGYQDLWQRAVIGVAMVSAETAHLENMVTKVVQEVEQIAPSELTHFEVEYF